MKDIRNWINRRWPALAFSIALILYGLVLQARGVFAYRNGYRLVNYSPGVIATGVVIGVLSLVPNRWMKKAVAATRKKR